MLPQAIVDEIRRLIHEEGLSQRKTARRLGVSRGVVQAISTGRRQDRVPRAVVDETLPGPDFLTLPKRCPRCGYLVYLPCNICRTRAYVRRHAPEEVAFRGAS